MAESASPSLGVGHSRRVSLRRQSAGQTANLVQQRRASTILSGTLSSAGVNMGNALPDTSAATESDLRSMLDARDIPHEDIAAGEGSRLALLQRVNTTAGHNRRATRRQSTLASMLASITDPDSSDHNALAPTSSLSETDLVPSCGAVQHRLTSKSSSLSELESFDAISGPEVKVFRSELSAVAKEVLSESKDMEMLDFELRWPQYFADLNDGDSVHGEIRARIHLPESLQFVELVSRASEAKQGVEKLNPLVRSEQFGHGIGGGDDVLPAGATAAGAQADAGGADEQGGWQPANEALLAANEDGFVKRGWMFKKGRTTHAMTRDYKRRWFDLKKSGEERHDYLLTYYAGQPPQVTDDGVDDVASEHSGKDVATASGVDNNGYDASANGSADATADVTRSRSLSKQKSTLFSRLKSTKGAGDSSGSSSVLVKGIVDLNIVTELRRSREPNLPNAFAFELVTPSRTWVLAPESKADEQAWLRLFCAIVHVEAIDPSIALELGLRTHRRERTVHWMEQSFPMDATVGEAIELVRAAYAARAGKELSDSVDDEEEDFVLKQWGNRAYLWQHAKRLSSYEVVQKAMREKKRAQLSLVQGAPGLPPLRSQKRMARGGRSRSVRRHTSVALGKPRALLERDRAKIIAGDLKWPFRVRIHGVEGLVPKVLESHVVHGDVIVESQPARVSHLIVRAFVVDSGNQLPGCEAETGPAVLQRTVPGMQGMQHDAHWRSAPWLLTEAYVSELPPASRVVFQVYGIPINPNAEPMLLANVAVPLFDPERHLVTGRHALRMWHNLIDAQHGPCVQNVAPDASVLTVEFDAYDKEVVGAAAELDAEDEGEREVLVARTGWLHKKGGNRLTAWRKRWFVLSEQRCSLCYFESGVNAVVGEDKMKGEIQLEGATVSDAPELNRVIQGTGGTRKTRTTWCFKVTPAPPNHTRTYLLQAESRQDMEDWMDAIAVLSLKTDTIDTAAVASAAAKEATRDAKVERSSSTKSLLQHVSTDLDAQSPRAPQQRKRFRSTEKPRASSVALEDSKHNDKSSRLSKGTAVKRSHTHSISRADWMALLEDADVNASWRPGGLLNTRRSAARSSNTAPQATRMTTQLVSLESFSSDLSSISTASDVAFEPFELFWLVLCDPAAALSFALYVQREDLLFDLMFFLSEMRFRHGRQVDVSDFAPIPARQVFTQHLEGGATSISAATLSTTVSALEAGDDSANAFEEARSEVAPKLHEALLKWLGKQRQSRAFSVRSRTDSADSEIGDSSHLSMLEESCRCSWLQTRCMLRDDAAAPLLRLMQRFPNVDIEYLSCCFSELSFNEQATEMYVSQSLSDRTTSTDGSTEGIGAAMSSPKQPIWQKRSLTADDRFDDTMVKQENIELAQSLELQWFSWLQTVVPAATSGSMQAAERLLHHGTSRYEWGHTSVDTPLTTLSVSTQIKITPDTFTAPTHDGRRAKGIFARHRSHAVFPARKKTPRRPSETVSERDFARMHHKLQQLWNSDPLHKVSSMQKALVWKFRKNCTTEPKALPKFLQAVNWMSPYRTKEALRLLYLWETLPRVTDALDLLDERFGDPTVRQYAVEQIRGLSDGQFVRILPQLVQALKFEHHHASPLARTLMERALASPNQIGLRLYWALRVEASHPNPQFFERYGAFISEYLKLCGERQRAVVVEQDKLWSQHGAFARIARQIQATKATKTRTKEILHKELRALQEQLPTTFQLPLNPRTEVRRLLIEECKVMSSAKKPLWLVFENAEPGGEKILAMFKAGDDLRQDCVTLQILQIMDDLWQAEGLTLDMRPYECIATWHDGGMLQIVKDADTTAQIHHRYGGKLGAYKDSTFADWIRDNNAGEDDYAKAVDLFVRSCAGYCVATYVMGIGDRHNDNIMVSKSGRYFHIDFGHFLGNFKYQFGIKRERTAFVFTPEMAHVMGGDQGEAFHRFLEYSTKAYNILRKNANTLINLFTLMVPAGMPELASREDINYMRDMLALDVKEDSEAAQRFRDEVTKSLNNSFRRFDNTVHILKHNL